MEWKPTKQQEKALKTNAFEILYGGARGGGKTEAGLYWLLYDIEHPQLRELVIRRNNTDLSDFIDRAKQIYIPIGAKFKGNPVEIHFPSGAIIYTGHLKDKDAYTKYQGWEIHRLLIEELTHIPSEGLYEKLLGSVRSTVEGIKTQVFLTTNPGSVGHKWVKHRFRIGKNQPERKFTAPDGRTRIFIPSRVYDNPYIMEKDPQYVKFLEGLKGKLRKQWLEGSWEDFEEEGAYYSKIISALRERGQITRVYPEPSLKTYTAWDLGMNDETAIWFFQIYSNEIRVINFYSNSGESLVHYITYVKDFAEKYGITYHKHFAPHDIMVREMSSGKSRWEIARELGITFDVAPKLSIADGIEMVRQILWRCWFDEKKCEYGIDALNSYRKEFNEKLNVFKDIPVHDWSSHPADAFRTFAVSYDPPKRKLANRVFNRHNRNIHWLGA